MDWLSSRIFKVISFVILFFFTWTSGGLFQVAYAVNSAVGQKVGSAEVKGKKPEEKLQKALDEIEGILTDTVADTETKKNKLKTKKSEIESLDADIKKQFKETEEKIKDLPGEIRQRHKDFVRKYEENLNILRTNLDDIEKAKTNEDKEKANKKAKEFLEKAKPPKKHTPLDPNKLPHRTEEEKQIVLEEYVLPPKRQIHPDLQKMFRSQSEPMLQVASNGSLKGLISHNTENISMTAMSGGIPEGSYQIALAAAPTADDLAENGIEIQFTPAILAKAAELGGTGKATKIYNWVRNNIEYVPTYGSIQGADMCLQTKQCNDTDTASLLISLYRASGIYAHYQTVTALIPIEKIKNLTGGFTDSMSALNLLASAGIPVKGLTEAGQIKYVQMERTVVEAFIDYIPSRGEIHRQGDTWIQLDPSFKQYKYTPGIDIQSAVPFDSQFFVNQIQSTATINETEGYVTNVDSAYINQTMTDYQTQVQNFITQTYPDATAGDVLGKKEIIQQNFSYLLGTLPYKPIATGATYSSLPDNLRHKITFNVTKDIYDSELGTPINITKALPELAGKKITLSYSPATPADEAVINKYLPKPHADGTPIQPNELPTSLPAYLINVKPELRVDGQVVARGTTIGLGVNETFTMSFNGPGANARDVITNEIKSGNYYGIAFDLSRVSEEQMQALKTKLETTKAKLDAQDFTGLTKDDILGDMLYTTALNYHAQLGVMNQVTAKTMGLVAITYPSETMFSYELKSNYYYGIPVSVSPSGLAMDADRLITLVKSLDGDTEKPKQFMLMAGTNGSTLEHSVPEQLWSTPENPAQGISAVKALQIANDQGIPIYTINKTNINTILPQLQIDYDDKTDIKNAVNAGKEVTVSKSNITFNGWTGVGYIVIDPKTGAGGYMISGGMNGGFIFAAWLAGLIILLILASFGLAAFAVLSSYAIGIIIAAIINYWPLISATILYITPIIIGAYNFCSKITITFPTAVKLLCTLLVTLWRYE